MAKRFSETEKWNDEWFCELKPLQKLIFLYMVDRCDNAGFIEVNARVASFLIGITGEQFEQGLKGLDKCLITSKDGKKLWLKNFLFHQKNLPLNPANNAHKQILVLLNENQEKFNYDFSKLGANEGLISPIGKGIGKGIGKEGGDFENLDRCKEVALKDPKYIRENKIKPEELDYFAKFLSKQAIYEKTLSDYKQHFSNWKSSGKMAKFIEENSETVFIAPKGTGALQRQREILNGK